MGLLICNNYVNASRMKKAKCSLMVSEKIKVTINICSVIWRIFLKSSPMAPLIATKYDRGNTLEERTIMQY